MKETERRLGFLMESFEDSGMSVATMLADANLNTKKKIQGLEAGVVQSTKETVYERILEYLQVEGYPSELNDDFTESNVNDLVYTVVVPIISAFRQKTHHQLRLKREKQIIAADLKMGGREEFVMVDMVSVDEKKYIFVVEGKKSSLGQAKRQCLLALKDMGEENGGGVVYGFVTSGEYWQMLKNDGGNFSQTDTIRVLFHGMAKERKKWMEEGATIVDCIHTALRCGGFF